MSFTITKLTAFVAIDKDNEEGVMGIRTAEGWMPLICADEARIKSMFPAAEKISKATNKPYRILQFSQREDVTEEITNKLKL